MELIAEKVTLDNIDKSSWKTYRFDQIAKNISERVEPTQTNLDIYVGLDHIDSDSIHIKRFGKREDVSGTKLRCYPGDVIFGRRRAYQRKAAIVTFDGFCSAHSLVLRANPEVILPELFPFFLHSDTFMHLAVDISVGSLSPTINWGDLKKQEFLLPPKDQQEQIAELLWAGDEMIERYVKLEREYSIFKGIAIEDLITKGNHSAIIYNPKLKVTVAKKWRVCRIGDLIDEEYILKIQDGNHGEKHPKSSDYKEEGIPFIMANTLKDGQIIFNEASRLPKQVTDSLRIGFALPNDVLLSHKGTIGLTAIIPEVIEWPYLMLTPQVTYYRVNHNKLSNKLLYSIFNADYFQKQIKVASAQSTRSYIGITSQKGLHIAFPESIGEQQNLVNEIEKISESIKSIRSSIDNSKLLQKSLINQFF